MRVCKNGYIIIIDEGILGTSSKLIFIDEKRVLIKLRQMYGIRVKILLLSLKTAL